MRRKIGIIGVTLGAMLVLASGPAGGPYFGKLDPAARYFLKIDDMGDGYESLGEGKTFVGPVDDPYFVDLGSTFDGTPSRASGS